MLSWGESTLMKKLQTTARAIFESGPAMATYIMSRRGLPKFLGSTGTGLAQPNPTKYIKSMPTISKCRMGLNESLPRRWAVSSPSSKAILPWEYSCTVRENKMTGVINIINCVLFKKKTSGIPGLVWWIHQGWNDKRKRGRIRGHNL